MTRSISPHSRVDFLKKEAKQWLKALKAGESAALARLRAALPEHDESVTLRTVQLALAREHGFAGWQALSDALGASPRERELREAAADMLRGAIYPGGDRAAAPRLHERYPEVVKLDLFCAVAAGNLEEVERRLAADPSAASRAGGPLAWPPLLYLAYLRWPGGAQRSVEVARALLDRGADPNASWNDGWDNPFKVLTGVIGLGEGVQPPHERADELAEVLIERGADPFDTQALYDSSIVGDDTHWLEVLWAHCERRGTTDKWSAAPAEGRASQLDLMLSIAVWYDQRRRAQWLLAHGADPNARHAYTKRLMREDALARGHEAMAELLTRRGAAEVPLAPKTAFLVACRKLDYAEVRRLAAAHPECLRDAEAILYAAHLNRYELVELLLDLGTDVDVEDSNGIRALGAATRSGALEVMRLLLDRGADVDRPGKHYDGPLGAAAFFGQRAAAELLAPRSRDVHNLVFLGMRDRLRELFAVEPALANLPHFRSGHTPLYMLPANEPQALEIARFLIEHGADPSVRDKDGDTAADAARKRGFESVAAFLSAPRG